MKRTVNAWKIDMGMFKGNLKQIFNKWTWGFINSVIGLYTAHVYNIAGQVDKVTEMDGMLALAGPQGSKNSAMTIGHYSFGPNDYEAKWQDHLFVHEYGHYIQSQRTGIGYLPFIGLPSLYSAWFTSKLDGVKHKHRWFETNASRLGAKHFDKKYGSGKARYKKGNKDYFDMDTFLGKNRIPDGNGYTSSPHENLRLHDYKQDQRFLISSPRISWWDFLIP